MGSRNKAASLKSRQPVTIEQKSVYKTPNSTRTEILIKKIGVAPQGRHFVLRDGRILNDFVQLSNSLEHMSDDVFRHHANDTKNDFRNWINDVFDEKELAAQVEKAKTREEMQLALLKHIVKETFS